MRAVAAPADEWEKDDTAQVGAVVVDAVVHGALGRVQGAVVVVVVVVVRVVGGEGAPEAGVGQHSRVTG